MSGHARAGHRHPSAARLPRVLAGPGGRWWGIATALALLLWGVALARSEPLSGQLAAAVGPGAVWASNLSVEATGLLVGVLSRAVTRRRAVAYSVVLTTAALWSYAGFWATPPAGLTGRADANFVCPQTSDDSCSAAAVSLLALHGVSVDEAEMARRCRTRVGKGTTLLELFHGIADVAPARVRTGLDANRLDRPVLISVGLKRGLSAERELRMNDCGWFVGSHRTVGKERWPIGDLADLWDGVGISVGYDGATWTPPSSTATPGRVADRSPSR